jgi:hypothetical protein
MAEFSMQLNEDQLALQKWVHGFAEDVMRPNAAEWDEREEFPYPIVEEAAQIGLYGWEFVAEAMMNDPCSGATPASGWRSPAPPSPPPVSPHRALPSR